MDLIFIILPALIVGLMIALTHALLGIEVLKRGIIFIDLAVAQIAGLGFIMAQTYAEHAPAFVHQGAALIFALVAAFIFRSMEKKHPQNLEALIGVSFVLSASVALLVLSNNPHGSEEIQHLLSGQILFTTWGDIIWHMPVYAFVLLMWLNKPQVKNGIWFYALFALAITSSVQLVGVYVVFASLILPALAACKAVDQNQKWVAWGCAVTAVTLGIIVSAITDLISGATIVCSYVFIAIIYTFLKKKASS